MSVNPRVHPHFNLGWDATYRRGEEPTVGIFESQRTDKVPTVTLDFSTPELNLFEFGTDTEFSIRVVITPLTPDRGSRTRHVTELEAAARRTRHVIEG